jgi:pimeloyl-ACP methyl ester carboxylesterase
MTIETQAAETATDATATTAATDPASDTWASNQHGEGAYADVNGLHLYYETFEPASGAATPATATPATTGASAATTGASAAETLPLVLLHGGLASGEMFGPVIPALAEGRRVIAPDLQGHGRTADIDRPIDVRLMADDIAALIRHLGLAKVDLLGYSLGGGVALFTAAKYPELVRKAVIVSANVRRDAIYPEMLAQQAQVSGGAAEFMKETPMYQLYQRVAPRPADFGRLLDKIGASMAGDFDYSDVVRSLQVPTLIACADTDMAPPSHYVEVWSLLGGNQRDGGWMNEGRPTGGHAFAVIPNATHYNVAMSPVLAAAAREFLGSPA